METEKPWKNPAARFAVPSPIISWSGRTSSPRRAPKLVEVAIVSVSETRAIPSAASSSGPMSLACVHGTCGVGSPCGSAPTVSTPFAERSSTAETRVAPTMAIRMAGSLRVTRGSTTRTASVARPSTRVVESVWSMSAKNALTSSTNLSASVENPHSFGS